MNEDASNEIDPRQELPHELATELESLVCLVEALEPVVAAVAERYDRLQRWDHAWPDDPDDPAVLDARVLASSGDDRVRALLTAIAARASAALEGAPTPTAQLVAQGLTGFGLSSDPSAAEVATQPPSSPTRGKGGQHLREGGRRSGPWNGLDGPGQSTVDDMRR